MGQIESGEKVDKQLVLASVQVSISNTRNTTTSVFADWTQVGPDMDALKSVIFHIIASEISALAITKIN